VRLAFVFGSLLCSATVFAHGNVPSPATFTSPPRLSAMATDAGDRFFAPYTFATADASFDVTWEDGDVDPISQHFFFYMDHPPPVALKVSDVEAVATAIPESAGGFWAACSCADDFGSCPDIGAPRDCRNGFTWDTHALAPGSYWIIAITRDAPYDIFTVSDGPVRIAHGGPLPPAVIVVRPDGFGTFDQSYTARWIVAGTDPVHVDLSYASDVDVRNGTAFKPLAADVPMMAWPDGTSYYAWDLTGLESARIFHLRATVMDASGITAFADSRNGVTVFHPGDNPDLAAPGVDMATTTGGDDGCALGGASPAPLGALLLGLVILIFALSRRRA
jgi:hypothetical protein